MAKIYCDACKRNFYTFKAFNNHKSIKCGYGFPSDLRTRTDN